MKLLEKASAATLRNRKHQSAHSGDVTKREKREKKSLPQLAFHCLVIDDEAVTGVLQSVI